MYAVCYRGIIILTEIDPELSYVSTNLHTPQCEKDCVYQVTWKQINTCAMYNLTAKNARMANAAFSWV